MSRVYTESVIADVCQGTAAYIWQFYKALPATRLTIAASPGFGGSLLDFFLNAFGTSDPFESEEIAIAQSWSQWDVWHTVDSQLHRIPLAFKASWPPPQQWVQTVDWRPLTQENPRSRHYGKYRTRKN